MTANDKYLDEALQGATAFESEKEPERLREAYIALENVNLAQERQPETRARVRLDCLSMWLHLVQLVDESVDPAFNPKAVPERLVQPPPTKDGALYAPGADPALIDDPKARADYENEIAVNRKKISDYRFQVHLSALKERIPKRAEEFIKNNYMPVARDQEELKKAIEKIITDPTRKAELRKPFAHFRP